MCTTYGKFWIKVELISLENGEKYTIHGMYSSPRNAARQTRYTDMVPKIQTTENKLRI
jgi:hypothetical protein